MAEWIQWLGQFENSKILALLLFFVAFCGILIYVYAGKTRSQRLESYKFIPLQDDEQDLDADSGEEEDNGRHES
ncbi:MAG: cbb3-type cytochrome c oxidase subunit 3 [Thiogranum sp.]|jgi:cbb3-type cytochrome oxidase subunit 3|nr:cbb3-type cytochrome c oxidase subunit 3 [Thiogranum sp.]